MIITYIGHSGFLVELKDTYLLFDYYEGTLPVLKKEKQIYVFSSHRHHDHYNPDVFSLIKAQGILMNQLKVILSKDIYYKKIPEDLSYLQVRAGEQITLSNGMMVHTLKSTDIGVAFLVFTKEGTIYHAGDLNDWVWKENTTAINHNMTANFRREIEKIKDIEIDVAFLPIDPRLEDNYANGLIYFLEHVKTQVVFPMHYWKQPETITRFRMQYPQFQNRVLYTENETPYLYERA